MFPLADGGDARCGGQEAEADVVGSGWVMANRASFPRTVLAVRVYSMGMPSTVAPRARSAARMSMSERRAASTRRGDAAVPGGPNGAVSSASR